ISSLEGRRQIAGLFVRDRHRRRAAGAVAFLGSAFAFRRCPAHLFGALRFRKLLSSGAAHRRAGFALAAYSLVENSWTRRLAIREKPASGTRSFRGVSFVDSSPALLRRNSDRDADFFHPRRN